MHMSIFPYIITKCSFPVSNAYNQKTEQNYKVLKYAPNQKY